MCKFINNFILKLIFKPRQYKTIMVSYSFLSKDQFGLGNTFVTTPNRITSQFLDSFRDDIALNHGFDKVTLISVSEIENLTEG